MDERNNHFDFDFIPIGQAIKKTREACSRSKFLSKLFKIFVKKIREIFSD